MFFDSRGRKKKKAGRTVAAAAADAKPRPPAESVADSTTGQCLFGVPSRLFRFVVVVVVVAPSM